MKAPRGIPLRPPPFLPFFVLLIALLGRTEAKSPLEKEVVSSQDTRMSDETLMKDTLKVLEDIEESVQRLINANQTALTDSVSRDAKDWVIGTWMKEDEMMGLKEAEEKEEEEAANLCPGVDDPEGTCQQLDEVLTNITVLTTSIADNGVTVDDYIALVHLSTDLDQLVDEAIEEGVAEAVDGNRLERFKEDVSMAQTKVKDTLDYIRTSEANSNTVIIVVGVAGGVMAIAISSGIVYGFVKNRKPRDDEKQILAEEIPVNTFMNQDDSIRPGETEYVPGNGRGATMPEYSRVYSSLNDDVPRGYTVTR